MPQVIDSYPIVFSGRAWIDLKILPSWKKKKILHQILKSDLFQLFYLNEDIIPV